MSVLIAFEGPSCSNEGCPCGIPGRVCPEFMSKWDIWCECCGWSEQAHLAGVE